MQLYVCVRNSFDVDSQRRADVRDLAARFVYVFRGMSEREMRGRKNTGQTTASAERVARKLNQDARCMQQRRLSVLWFFCLAFENVNKCSRDMKANAIGKY